MYVYKPYPMQVHCLDGAIRTVKNHIEHSVLTGIPHDENGEPIKDAEPPQAEVVDVAATEVQAPVDVDPLAAPVVAPEAKPRRRKGTVIPHVDVA